MCHEDLGIERLRIERAVQVRLPESLAVDARGHDPAEAVRLRNAARAAILRNCGAPDAAGG